MDTNGINLHSQDHQEKKQGRRRAFALGAVIVIGVASALGIGAMIGSNSSGGSEDQARRSGVDRPVQTTTVAEPTAVAETHNEATGQVLGGDVAPQGNTGGVSEQPATSTPEPVIPTETPVPPTNTPIPEEPTDTPTATPTTEPEDCPFCIDPVIVVLDFTAPQFLSGGRTHCPEGTIVVVTLDEEADIWVEYTQFGNPWTSDVQEDTTIGYFNLGGGPHIFPAMNIEVHAVDAWGNESTYDAPLYDCP